MTDLAAAIDAALPQTQCTRCGYPDCRHYAEAIAAGEAGIDRCPPGGAQGIARLSAITGRPVVPLNPENGVEGPRRLAVIDEAWCIGCTLCIKACPVDCIVGAPKRMHHLIDELCTGCDLCVPACPVDCISMVEITPGSAGWDAWSDRQADEARERYAFHRMRSERDKQENDERLALKAQAKPRRLACGERDRRSTGARAQARGDRGRPGACARPARRAAMKPEDVEPFFATLCAANPHPATELEYTNVFELLAAVLLSAQATDAGVNKATRRLFPGANTPAKMLALGVDGLAERIKTIGLFRTKAKNLHETCRLLVERHGGNVPRTREELEALPGVGRKTANVVLNVAFGEPTMAVDTHIFRVSNRTGLAPGKDALEVEMKLLERVPPAYRLHAHHWLILHGRYVCQARRPLCGQCAVARYCEARPLFQD